MPMLVTVMKGLLLISLAWSHDLLPLDTAGDRADSVQRSRRQETSRPGSHRQGDEGQEDTAT